MKQVDKGSRNERESVDDRIIGMVEELQDMIRHEPRANATQKQTSTDGSYKKADLHLSSRRRTRLKNQTTQRPNIIELSSAIFYQEIRKSPSV